MSVGALHGLYEKLTRLDDLNVTSLDVDDLRVSGTAAVASLRVTGTATVENITVLGHITAKRGPFEEFDADSATIGSADKPTGITLYDERTHEPYCSSIRNGDWVKTRAPAPGRVGQNCRSDQSPRHRPGLLSRRNRVLAAG
jgi:hypothetical protein